MSTIPSLVLVLATVLRPPQSATGSEGMTESQAWSAMFKAASSFASEKTPGWNHNAILYVIWRVDRAEIVKDCFWGEHGECLFKDRTDRELITTLYKTLKDGEAGDAGLQQWIRKDPSALPYASYFAAAVLKPNIDRSYRNASNELGKGAGTPSPETIVAYLVAVARRLREVARQDSTGWKPADFLGWLVLYHPSWGEEMANFAARIADVPIPYREIEGR